MRSYISIILVVLIALTISGTQPASAEIITVEVEGVVTHLGSRGGVDLDGSVALGSVMTGYCTYDTNVPDEYPANENVGVYPVISLSMTIGNYTFTHNPESNDPALFVVGTIDPSYTARSYSPRFDGTIYVDGSPKTYDDINWYYSYLQLLSFLTSSGEYIPTDALPNLDTWPDLSVFDSRREFAVLFLGVYGESNRYFGISGEITSLTVVPGPIEAGVDVEPDTLNLASKGKWISCYIWLPEDYNVADIDPNSVRLESEPNDIYADWLWFEEWEDEEYAMAKFRRQELQEILEPGEDVELTITGQLTDGTRFEGTDTIRVIDKGGRK